MTATTTTEGGHDDPPRALEPPPVLVPSFSHGLPPRGSVQAGHPRQLTALDLASGRRTANRNQGSSARAGGAEIQGSLTAPDVLRFGQDDIAAAPHPTAATAVTAHGRHFETLEAERAPHGGLGCAPSSTPPTSEAEARFTPIDAAPAPSPGTPLQPAPLPRSDGAPKPKPQQPAAADADDTSGRRVLPGSARSAEPAERGQELDMGSSEPAKPSAPRAAVVTPALMGAARPAHHNALSFAAAAPRRDGVQADRAAPLPPVSAGAPSFARPVETPAMRAARGSNGGSAHLDPPLAIPSLLGVKARHTTTATAARSAPGALQHSRTDAVRTDRAPVAARAVPGRKHEPRHEMLGLPEHTLANPGDRQSASLLLDQLSSPRRRVRIGTLHVTVAQPAPRRAPQAPAPTAPSPPATAFARSRRASPDAGWTDPWHTDWFRYD